MWRRCLSSAFRTALACSIVGGSTLFGPEFLKKQVAFPAFSYVTVILIVTDATLGATLRGCWLAFCATVQGVCPAILSLWLIGPSRLTVSITAAMAAVSAFVVALPETTHLISKRIALGQIVIVYVVAFINGGSTEPVMHPVHVAASTALGAVACVLALLFPYPRLALCEVKQNCKLYFENAAQRLKLFVEIFTAEDNKSPKALISQASPLNNKASKFLLNIQSMQENMQWERLPIEFLKSPMNQNLREILQRLETILRGMETALENCSEFPVKPITSELKNVLVIKMDQIMNQVKSMALGKSVLPQLDKENDDKFFQTLQSNTTPLTCEDLPSLFFVFCLKLLYMKSPSENSSIQEPNHDLQKNENSFFFFFSKIWKNNPITINKKRLMPALKCSLAIGFSVFFGLIYSKEDGYWSGLPVAISLAAAREATFKVANVKAQGMVLGTVYGVIGCFVFERYVNIRFISLFPWFVFCSFLRSSKMYGQAGGISAVIGAVLILGRKNFGTASEFAIARIVETFIGLSCSIMIDIVLQPTRAAALAKAQLSISLGLLHEAVGSMSIGSSEKMRLQERLKKVKLQANQLGKYIEEAVVEPNFWFLPFDSACYGKMMGSFTRMLDFLTFGCHALGFLELELGKMESWKEVFGKLENDFKVSRDRICYGIKYFEKVILVKSLKVLEKEFEKRKESIDLEMGKLGLPYGNQWSGSFIDEEEMEKNTITFLRHLEEFVCMEKDDEVEVMKSEVVLSFSALVFCMNGLFRETKEIEKGIKELVQWENPSSQVDLHEIVCKIQALEKNVTI